MKTVLRGTLTIRLPGELRRDLERMSREAGVPMGTLVRRSLQRTVVLQALERARAYFVPLARARGYYTDEDIFKIDT